MLLIGKRDSISNDARNNPTSINSCPSRSQKVFFLIPFKATPAATSPIPRRRWLPFPGLEGGPLCHSTTQNPFLFFWLKGITKKNVSTFVQKRIIICNSIAERDSQQLKKYNLAEVKDELMSSMSGILIFKQPVYNTLFRSLDALCWRAWFPT